MICALWSQVCAWEALHCEACPAGPRLLRFQVRGIGQKACAIIERYWCGMMTSLYPPCVQCSVSRMAFLGSGVEKVFVNAALLLFPVWFVLPIMGSRNLYCCQAAAASKGALLLAESQAMVVLSGVYCLAAHHHSHLRAGK
jgi:hypothetical protein